MLVRYLLDTTVKYYGMFFVSQDDKCIWVVVLSLIAVRFMAEGGCFNIYLSSNNEIQNNF